MGGRIGGERHAYPVLQDHHALGAAGAEVVGHEALDADGFASVGDLLLRLDTVGEEGGDGDVRAGEDLFEPLLRGGQEVGLVDGGTLLGEPGGGGL